MDYPSFDAILKTGPSSLINLAVLCLLSVGVWGVSLDKFIGNRPLRRRMLDWKRKLGARPGFRQLEQMSRESNDPMARLTVAALEEIRNLPPHLSEERQDELVSEALDRALDLEKDHQDRNMGYLMTCVTLGPLLGLLGTVWGVMNALLSIGAKGTAAIAVVAPGIAEALSTTIAGLLVGIPALIFFNIFLFQNRRIEATLNHYASELMGFYKRGDLIPPSSHSHGKVGKGADGAGYTLSA